MEINNIYNKYFIKYRHNINSVVFKTPELRDVILLDSMRLN